MVELQAQARKWGNSLGIIIPKDIAEREHILEGETIIVDLKKRHLAKEFFGKTRGWKKSLQSLKDEARKAWD